MPHDQDPELRDALRRKRHERLRLRLEGTADAPAPVGLPQSAKFIYAQVIDDAAGRTLAAASSRESGIATAAARSTPRAPWARRSPSGPRRPASRPWSSTAAVTSTTGGFARSPRAPARAASTCRAETNMARIDPTKLNLEEKVVQINRVAKVVKGGRRFSFSAVVVVGDRNGVVGAGLGKVERGARGDPQGRGGCEEAPHPRPAGGRHHPARGAATTIGAAHVMLKPASAGTGVIAGGSVRSVVEAAGIRDLLSQVDGQQQPGQRGARHDRGAGQPALRRRTSPPIAARPPSSCSASVAPRRLGGRTSTWSAPRRRSRREVRVAASAHAASPARCA